MMTRTNRRHNLEELYQPIVKFFAKFNSPKYEAIKEVARWVFMLILSEGISQTLAQANLLPDRWYFQVLIFTYSIPIRYLFTLGLTLAQRYIDKYIYLNNKAKKVRGMKATGLFPI